jgi:nitrate/TMAO reductase-like tetraheme cytochrome c subunit
MVVRIWKWFWRPAKRYAWGAVFIAGIVGGTVFLGSFNAVMENFNSLEFCISCHEMEQLVFKEYKKTIHYANRTGVRVTCADCHVPRDWWPKLWRKVQATNELFHKIIGSVDTRVKFEAKRLELAEHVWQYMEEVDSRECRECHSYEAMDFHRQKPEAQEMMEMAMKDNVTCIDCHKGIAHKLPDDYE